MTWRSEMNRMNRPTSSRAALAPAALSPQVAEGVFSGEPTEVRYAAFFAEHGNYQSYTDRQIRNYEEAWAITHPRKAPAVINITRSFFGDPMPGRVA